MGLQETMGFPLVSGSFHKTKGKVLFVVLCWREQMSPFNKVLKPVSSFNHRKNSSLLCFKYSAELGSKSKIALQPDFASIVCTYIFTYLCIYVCMYLSTVIYLFVCLLARLCGSYVFQRIWVWERFFSHILCNVDCWSHSTTIKFLFILLILIKMCKYLPFSQVFSSKS